MHVNYWNRTNLRAPRKLYKFFKLSVDWKLVITNQTLEIVQHLLCYFSPWTEMMSRSHGATSKAFGATVTAEKACKDQKGLIEPWKEKRETDLKPKNTFVLWAWRAAEDIFHGWNFGIYSGSNKLPLLLLQSTLLFWCGVVYFIKGQWSVLWSHCLQVGNTQATW